MKILLVYPRMPDTFYAMKHLMRMTGKKAVYPPLGLLTVASLLPADWMKRLADLNATSLKREDLVWADFVFISAMNVQEESVREIIELCRVAGARIVAGGPLFTHEHERFPGVDHFVLNEAEITLPLFLEDLRRGELKPVYRTDGFAKITTSPLPSFGLVKMGDYLYSILQYSRGCPWMCDFCDVTALYGRRHRIKSTAQVLAELDAINSQGHVRSVLFADDNLIGNKRVLKQELLPALIDWRRRNRPAFMFATQLTIDLADDDELMALMLDAGFRQVFIGIETQDEATLKGSGKIQNLKRDQLANIHKLHRAGFYVAGGFIIGFDTDTPLIFKQQADFIQQSGIPLPIVNLLKAPYGTELYKRLEKEGRLKERFAFSEGDTNIIPLMDEKVLHDGFLELMDSIYLPRNSFQRLIVFFSTYQYPATTIRTPVKIEFHDLLMVLRAIFLVGIKDPHRKYFWKLLFRVARRNYKYLDMGLFYAVMIYQMHQTSLHIRKAMNQAAS